MSEHKYSKLINAGMKSKLGGGQVAGVYIPAKEGGNACFQTTLFVVNPKHRDKEGNLVEERETLFCSIFNNPNGTAHADMFARYLSLGKTLEDVTVKRSQYRRQKTGVNGELLTNADGSPAMEEKEGYKIIGYSFGRDSNKLVEAEVAAWDGTISFSSRPPFWNGCPAFLVAMGRVQLAEVEQGKNLWEQVAKARGAAMYQPGSQYYGYAEVKTVAQPAVIHQPAQPISPVQMGQNIAQVQGQPMVNPVQQVVNPAPTIGAAAIM